MSACQSQLLHRFTESGLLCRNSALMALYCLNVIVCQMSKACHQLSLQSLHVLGIRWLLSQPDELLGVYAKMHSLPNVTGHKATK